MNDLLLKPMLQLDEVDPLNEDFDPKKIPGEDELGEDDLEEDDLDEDENDPLWGSDEEGDEEDDLDEDEDM